MESQNNESVANEKTSPLAYGAIKVDGEWFKDEEGRVLLLRGVNLGANAKLPANPPITSFDDSPEFFDHRNVSFVGRPFPIEEAHTHFQRLKRWGLTFLRFLVTWEAIEHSGPGIYDEEYLDYIVEILKIAKSYGFSCFIDPHQDVWSRFTGGSGCPGWTLELAGFDIRKFDDNNAAIVHNTWPGPKIDYPIMIWPSNYSKLACATMFTLFFGGKTFAPNLLIDGVNIQDYLQSHFINSIIKVAERVKDLGVVVGYDTFNEPNSGFIGVKDLSKIPDSQILRAHQCPTPFETMLLGNGNTVEVDFWERSIFGPKKTGTVIVNEKKVSCWQKNRSCIWADHKVWDPQTNTLLQPEYFSANENGDHYEFLRDFWVPFACYFSREIRKVHPNAIIFAEPSVNDVPPTLSRNDIEDPIVYAPHWYDGLTLYNKTYAFWNLNILGITRGTSSILTSLSFGDYWISKGFALQFRMIKSEGRHHLGECPCLIGEVGIPYDLNSKNAYKTNDYSAQVRAMNASLSALEANLLNYTIWNYCPENSYIRGDHWNGEDFSIFSNDAKLTQNEEENVGYQSEEGFHLQNMASSTDILEAPIKPNQLDAGGRALKAVIRPYAVKTAGIPKTSNFNIDTCKYTLIFKNQDYIPDRDVATEIFLPEYHFGDSSHNFTVEVSDGEYFYDPENQLLTYVHQDLSLSEHKICISKNRPKSSFWDCCKFL